MPKKISNQKTKKPKKFKMKSGVPDTGRATVGKINLVGKVIDIEGSLKKNKEVKEKDVFDFSSKSKN
jgi:hypothetical protein